ncbi:MAG: serine hydrolase [Candidatus Eisenbacteria bacterium]|nr:serine hydrolase [Candidatus Eisenbacteria bacterium]
MAVAVSMSERTLYAAGFGFANANTVCRASDETAFYIASSTKALTATAVTLLAAHGEYNLQASVARHVPGLRFKEPLDAGDVTMERLLTLTHGIEPAGPVTVRTAFAGDFSGEFLVGLLADYGPSESGNTFRYDNLGYVILGMALDPGGGRGWKRVVQREVLDPLGMRSTRKPPRRAGGPTCTPVASSGGFRRSR